MSTIIPTSEDFYNELVNIFHENEEKENSFVTVISGELHRLVGGYPGSDHRMPVCCSVMLKAMRSTDTIISQPPKGKGASLTIRYVLPR